MEFVRALPTMSELDQISTERLLEIFLRTKQLKSAVPTELALRAPLVQNRANIMSKLWRTGFVLDDAEFKARDYDELQFVTTFMTSEQRKQMAYQAQTHYSQLFDEVTDAYLND